MVCSLRALTITAMVRLSLIWPQPRVVPPVLASAPARPLRLISSVLPSSGRIASPMVRARASAALMLLPKAPLWSANNHWIPRSWPSITSISTMIASTSTWARRISSRWMTASIAAISSVSAVMISELVPSSASIVAELSVRGFLAPSDVSRRLIFCMTRVSTSAISGAWAYSRYTTLTLPLCSNGVSRYSTSLRIRARSSSSPLTSTLLVRASATNSTSVSPPLCLASDLVNWSSMLTTFSATP